MEVIHTNKAEFEKIIQGNSLVLVDFWATWCGPCRMIAPVLEKIAEKYAGKAVVAKVDIDTEPDLAVKYGIQSIPTVILFKNGEPAKKEVGVKPQEIYESMIEKKCDF